MKNAESIGRFPLYIMGDRRVNEIDKKVTKDRKGGAAGF
jgi:hypothetical protein